SERIPAAAGIVNLRYKSCPEMAGQDHFFVEGDGYITTGGKLHLNTSGTKPGTTAPGSGHKGDIDAAVQAKFTPKDE
ncbi:type VI secretion system tip protein VgrG, partial [Enterobacter roggenkampii]